MRNSVKYLYIALSVAFVALIIWKVVQLRSRINSDRELAVSQARAEVQKAVDVFNERLGTMMSIADSLADKITRNELDSLQIINELTRVLNQNKDIFGFGVGYEPFEFSKNRRLFAPFFIRPNDSIQVKLLEDSYDYTERKWYFQPLREGKAWFEPPYIGEVSQKLMAEYSVPFYKVDENGKKVPIGIVYLDYTIEDLARAVKSLHLGKSGYGFVCSKDGLLMTHPMTDLVKKQKTIDTIAALWNSPQIKQVFKSSSGESDFIPLLNPENGNNYRMFFQDIDKSGWKMVAVFVEDAFKTDYNFINHRFIEIILFSFLLVFAISLYFLHKNIKKVRRVYLVVGCYTVLVMVAIGFVWSLKLNKPMNIYGNPDSYPVTDNTTLQKFLDDQDSLKIYHKEPLSTKIPTGVFLKHVEFEGSHNIRLSGIVWQNYPNTLDSSVVPPRLFFIETAPNAEALSYEKIYATKLGDRTVHGWYFRLEVRTGLSYEHYPFDWETISLRLGYPDFSKDVLLIPDLGSYSSINPQQLPGLDKKVVLPDWDYKGTYFDFKSNHYNTNFGVWGDFAKSQQPDLYYNLVLKRKPFWPFLSNFIPLFTIALLLFMSVLSFTSKEPGKTKKIGFTGFGVLELSTAFLFVAILTHIDLRGAIEVNYVIYLDYFYFHMYLLILLYSVNAIIFTRMTNVRFIHYRDNIIPKLIFWPLLTTSLFLFTCGIFYE